jgi:hypothetical protein
VSTPKTLPPVRRPHRRGELTTRVCEWEGCTNLLRKGQLTFCSKRCSIEAVKKTFRYERNG